MNAAAIFPTMLRQSDLSQAEQWHAMEILEEAPANLASHLSDIFNEFPELIGPAVRMMLRKGHALISADETEWEEIIASELEALAA